MTKKGPSGWSLALAALAAGALMGALIGGASYEPDPYCPVLCTRGGNAFVWAMVGVFLVAIAGLVLFALRRWRARR